MTVRALSVTLCLLLPQLTTAQTAPRPDADPRIEKLVATNDRGGNLLSRDPSGYDATMRWNPTAGAVAYRVYWRDTWSNGWQHSQTIGNVTQFTLKNVSIDDFAFGVSAIGVDGDESLVSSYVSPVRRDQPLKK